MMNLLFIVLSLCMIIILINSTNQIINGFIADIDSFKYQVALITLKGILCSGAIIDEHHVLTAAHCVYNLTSSEVTLIAGVATLNDSDRIIKTADRIHIHPNYSRERVEYNNATGELAFIPPLNDVAVFTIFEAYDLGDRFQIIDLPSKTIEYCTPCIVAGWGAIEMNGPTPNALRFVELVISDFCHCDLESHACNEFCAYDPWQTSIPSAGDSGSPLNCGGEVVGVNSHGSPHLRHPTVFASVYDHLDFIKKSMCDC